MRLFIAILTYVVMVSIIYIISAFEAVPQQSNSFLNKVPYIPWYYNHPYRGKLTYEYLLPQEVHIKCGGKMPLAVGQPFFMACAFTPKDGIDKCHIVLPLDIGMYYREEMAYIVRHEIAHCNGWDSDHSFEIFWDFELESALQRRVQQ